MATAVQTAAEQSVELPRAVVTKIVSKFQVTVPQEVRDVYGLREGDLFEWHFDAEKGYLIVIPKRAQLITPRVRERIGESRRMEAASAVATT